MSAKPSVPQQADEEEVPGGMSATRRKRIEAIKAHKEFFFRVDKVVCVFESTVEDVFLEFEFGGKIRDARTEKAVEVKRKVKKTNAEGVEEEVEVTDLLYKREVQIYKPRAAAFFSRLKANVKAKMPCPFHGFSFDGTWQGKYDDMEAEFISIRVWRKVWFGANQLLGVGRDPLNKIAASKMDREVRVYKYVPGGQTQRPETVCQLRYKCEFQEKYQYNIDFRDWQLVRREAPKHWTGHESDDDEADEADGLFKRVNKKKRELQFQLDHSWLTPAEKCWYCICPFFKHDTARLQVERYFSKRESGIQYNGTRAWLEDENLTISMWKYVGPCYTRVQLGSVSADLQGVLDYGYLEAYLNIKENVNFLNTTFGWCGCGGPQFLSKFKIKGVIDSNRPFTITKRKEPVPMPLFRQLGNSDPKLQMGLFGRGDQPYTFLVFKIIRCKGLQIPYGMLDEFKDNLCPSVTIEWNSIRKSSRMVKGSDAYWDDECHFKIPDRLNVGGSNSSSSSSGAPGSTIGKKPEYLEDFSPIVRTSMCTLSVWDNDNFAKTPLGYCTVNFEDIYRRRKKKKIRAFASNGRIVDRFVFEMKGQTLHTPFSLTAVPPIVDLKLAHSNTTHNNSKNPKKQQGKNAGKPNTSSTTTSSSSSSTSNSSGSSNSTTVVEPLTPFIEYMVYFDRLDSHAVPVLKKKRKKKHHQVMEDGVVDEYMVPDLSPEYIRRGRQFWDDALTHIHDRSHRFFTFLGKDEYSGKYYFLPCFVKPMQPPNELRLIGKLLYFIYSIECVRKTEVLVDPVTQQLQTRNDVWQWCDPYFFLEKRRGDLKDHALLLCNFLLGLGHRAYVCIGTARTRSSKKSEPHVWVMTLEEEEFQQDPDASRHDDAGEQMQQPSADASSSSSSSSASSSSSSSSSAPLLSSSSPAAGPPRRKLVRFWETTNGTTYELYDRFHSLPRAVYAKKFEEQQDEEHAEADEDVEKEELAEQIR